MSADDKAAAAWDDYIDQQQEEKIEELERELNAANQRIDMLTACNADVARIAKERDDALERIKRLEEAGDALKASGYFGGFGDAVNKWIKVKEDKP